MTSQGAKKLMCLHRDIKRSATQNLLVRENIKDCLAEANNREGFSHELVHCRAAIHVNILSGYKAGRFTGKVDHSAFHVLWHTPAPHRNVS